jgi:hypothetical protein
VRKFLVVVKTTRNNRKTVGQRRQPFIAKNDDSFIRLLKLANRLGTTHHAILIKTLAYLTLGVTGIMTVT